MSEVFEHFSSSFGRPTREFFFTLGALIPQQAFDFRGKKTVRQFAFNIQWHYALNISEESDDAKYISPKTLWKSNMRRVGDPTDKSNHPVELKSPKAIPASSLQNPSDPEASYSGYKGQGYPVQAMEIFCEGEQDKDDQNQKTPLSPITHVVVKPAHNSDADTLIPAIESRAKKDLNRFHLPFDQCLRS
ncbi:MAG: hypothetical protein AB7S84_11490 [Desulfococcus sp.]